MANLDLARVAVALAGVIAAAPVAAADVLEVRDGTLVNGKYAGGTASTVRIETADGIKVFSTSEIVALT
jgi:hypothetical protein